MLMHLKTKYDIHKLSTNIQKVINVIVRFTSFFIPNLKYDSIFRHTKFNRFIAVPSNPKVYFLLLYCFCINLQFAYSQLNEADFEQYTVLNGLSDNNVNCIAQDDLGYIWVGTEMGLNSFDGNSFVHHFSNTKPLNLAGLNVVKFIPLSNHRLGIILRRGFQVINTKNLSTQNYRFPDTSIYAIYENGILDAAELPDKSILISSGTGIYTFDKPGHVDFRYDHHKPTEVDKKQIVYGQKILMIDDAEALIYTTKNGLDHYDFQTKTLMHLKDTSNKWKVFYPNQQYGTSYEKIAPNQFVFFNRYSDSITFYDGNRNLKVTSFPFSLKPKELIWSSKLFILNDTDFAITCAYTGFYVFHLNKETGIISCDSEKYMPMYKCNSLMVDNEKRLWIGTRNGLLKQKKYSKFITSYSWHQDSNPGFNSRFNCIYRYTDKLYIGSQNRFEGLYVVDTATMQLQKKITFYGGDNGWSEIYYIQCYHKDTLWIGTTNGLLWLDINSYHYGYVKDNKGDSVLVDEFPFLFPPDKNGNAWLGGLMNGKAGYYNPVKRTFRFFTKHTQPALPFKRIKHVVYDAYGDVWLAGHGLARWNNAMQIFDTLITVYDGPNKFNDDILAIAADKKGSLWLFNAENVLLEYKIKEKKFYPHGAIENLPVFVQSMSNHINDKFWFTTGSQLICYEPTTKKIYFFDQEDGLPSDRSSTRSIYFDADRNCYYSLHNNYLAVFSNTIPKEQQQNKRLLITHINLADTTFYNPTGTINLDYTQKNFSVHFTVLDNDFPIAYKFYYQLDNKDWIDLDGRRVLFFNKLSPGNRIIKIKAISKLGEQHITSITLEIEPPFWQRWWFIAMLVLVVITIIYTIYKYRINQVKKFYSLRSKISRDLHDDIGSTLGSISVYSEVASSKLKKNEAEITAEVLQKIGDTSRLMIDRMSDIVWSINSANDTIQNLIDRMKSFGAMMLAPRSIHLHFDVDKHFIESSISMDTRKNIFLIYKEAIHNIVKYADCTNVEIKLLLHNHQIIMKITDDGNGFDVNQLSAYNGNGLKNMKARAEETKGNFSITSEINKGTKINLVLNI